MPRKLASHWRMVRVALDTHLRIHTGDISKGLALFLKQQFTKSNPVFFKKRRMGFWLGDEPSKIKSYEIDGPWLCLPRGSLDTVRDLLFDRRYRMEPVFDRTMEHAPIKLEMKKSLYTYQADAVENLVSAGGGIIRGPCGSGKTVCLIGAMVAIQQPTLIIVHSQPLLEQWRKFLGEFIGVTPGNLGGKRKDTVRSITVGMQQTICRRRNAHWIDEFGCIIGDECHKWAAASYQMVANMFPAKWRLAGSADERRKDGKEFLIYETFGPLRHKITKEELNELGRLVPIRVELVPTEYEDEFYLTEMQMKEDGEKVTIDWVSMISRIVEDNRRNQLILKHIKRVLNTKGTRILMLSERVDACHEWVERLEKAGIRCGLLIGGSDNREELSMAILKLKAGKIRVGVGTKVADEGLDIPPLTHVFFTCPIHTNPKRMNQMAGRSSRKYGNKQEGVAVYFWDRNLFPYVSPDTIRTTRERKMGDFIKIFRGVFHAVNVLEE